MGEFLRKHVLLLVLADVLAALVVFGVQGYQINQLNSQQAQITQNSQKNDCWSAVLDNALKYGRAASYRTRLIAQAEACVKLP